MFVTELFLLNYYFLTGSISNLQFNNNAFQKSASGTKGKRKQKKITCYNSTFGDMAIFP